MKANFHDNVGGMTRGRDAKVGCAVHELDAEGGAQPQAGPLAAKPISMIRLQDKDHELTDGSVVIAAITSCTNTYHPAVMLGAGPLGSNAAARCRKREPSAQPPPGPGYLGSTQLLMRGDVMEERQGD